MRMVLAAFCTMVMPLEAMAISRYTATSMACGEIRAVVDEEGAAIMRFRSERNPSLQLYERVVRNSRFCQYEEQARINYIPSADDPSCPVYLCEKVEIEDFRIWLKRRH